MIEEVYCYNYKGFISLYPMEFLLTSIFIFAATNIDDLFILALFYGNKRFNSREIVIGQLLGIGMLIFISLAASLIGLVVPTPYIGLLGLFPIFLGVKALWHPRNQSEQNDSIGDDGKGRKPQGEVLEVAGVTFANGGDNIAIYIPLFTSLTWPYKLSMVGIFFAMTFVWCGLARCLTKHPYVSKTIDKYGHWITPFILILLGTYILYDSGSIRLVIHY